MAGHRRAEATPSFRRLCPAMTRSESSSEIEPAADIAPGRPAPPFSTPPPTYSCRDWPRRMTVLLQLNVSSITAERRMSLEWQARSGSLTWTNPVSWWWGLLTLVSGVNIAVWFVLYRELPLQLAGAAGATSSIGLMLLFCAAYVFGCAFRSFLPRADVQRICLFDTWWSSVLVGRTVATVAEIAFVAQWAILLHQLGTM